MSPRFDDPLYDPPQCDVSLVSIIALLIAGLCLLVLAIGGH